MSGRHTLGAALRESVRQEVHDRADPEREDSSRTGRARDTQAVFEQLGHVVAETRAKGGRKRVEQQAVHVTYARPRAQFLALASRTTSASLAVSAAATRRPNAVMR